MKIGYIFIIASIIFIGIAGYYIMRHFTGLGNVPTRSAFAGRLPSIPEGNRRRLQFFYTTNRANIHETFEEQGNVLGSERLTGTFDVLISPYMAIEPFAWFDESKMEWKERKALDPDLFHLKLKQAIQNSPQKSILIIVWGFRDWFRSAALKTAYTAYVLDINTPVLLFDWPGNQGEGVRGYAASQRVATASASDLGHVLAKILKETGAEKVWLMGSSLGCQTVCDSLAWLAVHSNTYQAFSKIDHVILSAPDVSAQAFNEKFSETILALSRHLTAYVSSNDRALLMSHWLNGERRLGRKAEILVPPENRISEYEFEEALELLELKAKGAKNISIVDVTPINFLRNLHHFFTDSSVFFDDLYQRLLQPEDIVSRRLHSVHTNRRGANYWILWND